MDEKRRGQIIKRLTQLDPQSDEATRLLLEVAEGSDHPNDVAIARVLRRELGIVKPGTLRIPALETVVGEEPKKRLMVQALSGLCTHNYGWFEWHPCHRPAVAMVWWDNEISRLSPAHRYICGQQVRKAHLIAAITAAREMGAVVVGRC